MWGYYPSLYYPAFGFGWGPAINLGFCFGGWGGWGGWGWGPNWFGRTVFVNNLFFHRYGFHGVRDASFNRAPGHTIQTIGSVSPIPTGRLRDVTRRLHWLNLDMPSMAVFYI